MEAEIVIPTLNAGRTLRRCLESLQAQSCPVTVTVVDGGSSDGTLAIAKEMADRVMHSEFRGFSVQRNLGAKESNADWLGFIDADMALEETVVAEVNALISGGAIGVAIPEVSFGSTYWARVRAYERSFYEGEDSPEAARCFVRGAFTQAGGYDERLSAMEDFALDRTVRAIGPIARTDAKIWHDEGHLTFLGATRKKARYATGMAAFARLYGRDELRGFLFGRSYVRAPLQLLKDPKLGVGVVALKSGESVAAISALVVEYQKKIRHERN
jgi:glycosyltransferase involved in cell wall biosynthesis